MCLNSLCCCCCYEHSNVLQNKISVFIRIFCVFCSSACSLAHHSHTSHNRRQTHVVIVSKRNDNNKNKLLIINELKQNKTVLKWHSEFLVPLNTAKKAPQMFTIYVTIYEKKIMWKTIEIRIYFRMYWWS